MSDQPTTPANHTENPAAVALLDTYEAKLRAAEAAHSEAIREATVQYQADLARLHQPTSDPAAETQIAFIIDILERGNHVAEWPADEAAAYREFRFKEGTDAVNRLRAQKIITFLGA